jgi:diguanylate cyclase (GGDEF)-like protein/PAS domain S-box-containing protein
MVKSPAKRLVLVLTASIFISESLIMLALSFFPEQSILSGILFDSIGLVLLTVPAIYLLVFKPITEYVKQLQSARNELRITSSAFETHEAIMIADAKQRIIRVNRAFEAITGYKETEVLGQSPEIFHSDRHLPEFHRQIAQRISATGKWNGEMWCKRKDDELYVKRVAISVIKNGLGDVINYVHSFVDIAKEKKAQEEVLKLAFQDQLTGLSNRKLLQHEVTERLEITHKNQEYNALVLLDIDYFKSLNDTLGHDYGDNFLVQVANRLRLILDSKKSIYRIGGDEFVVLLDNLGVDPMQAQSNLAIWAERIRDGLSEVYILPPFEHYAQASIGTCLFTGHARPAKELLKCAEIAMYEAKGQGGNRVAHFDQNMKAGLEEKANLVADLHSAISNNQLRLFYQIQVDATHRPIGVEALMRWNHPVLGMIPPSQFIAIAEESSLIVELGDWGLEVACRQLGEWKKSGNNRKDLVLAYNVSAKQFKQPNFVEYLETLIHRYEVDPSLLKLELTETLALDNLDYVISKMHELKSRVGVSLSLDDFGTGYSSLSYLKQMPFDQVKIDQGFIKGMTSDSGDASLVKTMIDMSKNLNLEVIAEGVETDEQFKLLEKFGCVNYQGYLFGKPLPINEFEKATIH